MLNALELVCPESLRSTKLTALEINPAGIPTI